MQASVLLARLHALVADHGDLPVWLHDPDTGWCLDIDVGYCTTSDSLGYGTSTPVPHIAIDSGYSDRWHEEPQLLTEVEQKESV